MKGPDKYPSDPPKSKDSKSKKSSKDKSKSSKDKSKSKDPTTKTQSRTGENDEGEDDATTEERSGLGEATDDSPPYESSFSRRNFRFPWLLLGIFGGFVSLVLWRQRRQHQHDDSLSV